jgi:hypothetical protein
MPVKIGVFLNFAARPFRFRPGDGWDGAWMNQRQLRKYGNNGFTIPYARGKYEEHGL